MMLKRIPILASAWLVLLLAGSAQAHEYCVTCEGPPAMYRCVIDGTEDGAGKDPSASLYCISQMASQGHHTSCAVSRGAPFPCPGLTAVVAAPKNLPPPPTQAAESPAEAPAAAPGEPPATAPPAEAEPAKVPRTVEELAGQSFKSSKESLKQAGDAIGGTAKKAGEHIGNAGSAIGNAASQTWNCITSLFSHCSSETAEHEEPEPTGTAPPEGEHQTN
jgi:hypothetical protein